MFLKPLDLLLSVSGSEGLELNTTENLHCPQQPLLAAGDGENIKQIRTVYICINAHIAYIRLIVSCYITRLNKKDWPKYVSLIFLLFMFVVHVSVSEFYPLVFDIQ